MGSASAHALYERSDPPSGGRLEAPGELQIWFTEAIELGFTKVQILDSSRRAVGPEGVGPVSGAPRSLLASVGALPDGTYTISWQALSAVDGHVTRGLFPLIVGAGGLSGSLETAPDFVPGVGDVVARWLGYLAALALVGGLFFRLAVLAPIGQVSSPLLSGVDRRIDQRDLLRAYDARFRRFGLAATAVLIVASLVGITVQAANAADVPVWQALGGPLWRLLDTRLGLLWEARLALAVTIGLVFWRTGRSPRCSGIYAAGLATGLALLAAISLNSHAAALLTGTWLAVGLDWLHQVAAAAWIGGLFAFAVLIPFVLRPLAATSRTRVLAALVPRFSALALISVAVLTLTGAFQAWLQVSSWAAFGTLYGGSLIVKLILIAPLLLLGAANLLVARPSLARAAAGLGRDAPRLIGRFRAAVSVEAVLGIGVLLATAVLTASEPARETFARQPRPIELAGVAEDVGVAVRIAPGRPGANTVDVHLDGPAPADVQRVTLRFTYLDQDLGSGNLILERREDGSHGAVSSNLSTEGHWQIETLVRQRGRDDVRVGFRIDVDSAEAAGQPPSLDLLAILSTVPPGQAIAAGLMALGLVLAIWIVGDRRADPRRRVALSIASLAIVMIGGVLYARAIGDQANAQDLRSLRNPFPPDTTSLARGRALYEQNCASCHGVAGRGDGVLAPSLNPRPADFRVHMEAGHTDGELFAWMSKGVPGTAMPAFEGQLPEADRWHIINYIRGFTPAPE